LELDGTARVKNATEATVVLIPFSRGKKVKSFCFKKMGLPFLEALGDGEWERELVTAGICQCHSAIFREEEGSAKGIGWIEEVGLQQTLGIVQASKLLLQGTISFQEIVPSWNWSEDHCLLFLVGRVLVGRVARRGRGRLEDFSSLLNIQKR
jgi:hypothetical protein